jgi:hypothetical protein
VARKVLGKSDFLTCLRLVQPEGHGQRLVQLNGHRQFWAEP